MKILDIQNDLPKQIELVICDEFDEGQEAYMYIITCKKTNKWYLGIHMDKDKYYWKSATDEEFRKLFSNKESKFEYKLLESGTYSYMKDREYVELTKVDARNNPMSWNRSNGIPNSKNMIDEDLINEIHSKIKNNEYKKITLTKAEVKPIDFYQSRIQEVDWSRVQEITSQIQSKAGSTHVCDPLILFDGTTTSDDYFGIDGKHTSQGFLGAKLKPGDIITINGVDSGNNALTEDIQILTVNEVQSTGLFGNLNPFFDLLVQRDVFATTNKIRSVSAGSVVTRSSGARLLTIDGSRLIAISSKLVWIKENRNIIKTNDRGFVTEIVTACTI